MKIKIKKEATNGYRVNFVGDEVSYNPFSSFIGAIGDVKPLNRYGYHRRHCRDTAAFVIQLNSSPLQ